MVADMLMSPDSVVHAVEWLNDTDPIANPARFTWDFRRKGLRERMLSANGNLDELYTWPVAREFLVTGDTGHARRLERALPQEYGEIVLRVRNSPIVGTHMRQAYACHALRGMLHADARVFEFGGGLGVLPIMMASMGHTGAYLMYDFPEMTLIQEWFHSRTVLDNVLYVNRLYDTDCDIFVSICALDETSVQVRKAVLSKVHAPCHLVWMTKSYLGVDKLGPDDNLVWFEDYYGRHGFAVTRIDSLDDGQAILLSERHAL